MGANGPADGPQKRSWWTGKKWPVRLGQQRIRAFDDEGGIVSRALRISLHSFTCAERAERSPSRLAGIP
jgi:hypothetical protein